MKVLSQKYAKILFASGALLVAATPAASDSPRSIQYCRSDMLNDYTQSYSCIFTNNFMSACDRVGIRTSIDKAWVGKKYNHERRCPSSSANPQGGQVVIVFEVG